MSNLPPVAECFRDAEECLREEFGTEVFKRGVCKINARVLSVRDGFSSTGDDLLSTPKRGLNVEISVFKDDWEGEPKHGHVVVWESCDGPIRLKVNTWSGGEASSPTYQINLESA